MDYIQYCNQVVGRNVELHHNPFAILVLITNRFKFGVISSVSFTHGTD